MYLNESQPAAEDAATEHLRLVEDMDTRPEVEGIAIDQKATKLIDDAIHAEELPDGRMRIQIHIADVAAQINPERLIKGGKFPEDDALDRMALSPDELRPSVTYECIVDEAGNISDERIFRSKIKVQAKQNRQFQRLPELPIYKKAKGFMCTARENHGGHKNDLNIVENFNTFVNWRVAEMCIARGIEDTLPIKGHYVLGTEFVIDKHSRLLSCNFSRPLQSKFGMLSHIVVAHMILEAEKGAEIADIRKRVNIEIQRAKAESKKARQELEPRLFQPNQSFDDYSANKLRRTLRVLRQIKFTDIEHSSLRNLLNAVHQKCDLIQETEVSVILHLVRILDGEIHPITARALGEIYARPGIAAHMHVPRNWDNNEPRLRYRKLGGGTCPTLHLVDVDTSVRGEPAISANALFLRQYFNLLSVNGRNRNQFVKFMSKNRLRIENGQVLNGETVIVDVDLEEPSPNINKISGADQMRIKNAILRKISDSNYELWPWVLGMRDLYSPIIITERFDDAGSHLPPAPDEN